MPGCLKLKLCLQRCVHWPGIIEAGLHCLYTGFFVIEAATYGLILEQKFHGVLQIVLINFYLVLLCLVFIRWNMDINSAGCHLLISLLSFILTIFVGKLILMYIDFMERPRQGKKINPDQNFPSAYNRTIIDIEQVIDAPKKIPTDIMKLDPLIVILDIVVYLLISVSYIVMLIKISMRLRRHSKSLFSNLSSNRISRGSLPTLYDLNFSESSTISSITVT